MHVGNRELIEHDATRFRRFDNLAGNAVRFAERQSGGADQPVGEIGRGRVALRGGVTHGLGHRLEIANHSRRRGER